MRRSSPGNSRRPECVEKAVEKAVEKLWKVEPVTTPTWKTLLVSVVCALTMAACRGETIIVPAAPTPVPAAPTKHTIQFRVTGNASSVRVRYSEPIDGLGQVVTSLPYFNTLTIAGDSLFLSLEGTPLNYGGAVFFPFLSVQIVVDNTVFREATSQDFLLSPLSVSGQWRQ